MNECHYRVQPHATVTGTGTGHFRPVVHWRDRDRDRDRDRARENGTGTGDFRPVAGAGNLRCLA